MNRMKFHHFVSKKKQGKQMSVVDAYSPDRAIGYATKLFQMVVKGWGDAPLAIEECAKRSGMSERSYERLMKGETKDPKLTVLGRVRTAYLGYCEEQVARLQHEIHIEKTRSSDGSFEDLAAEAAALAEKIKRAKGR
jgi:transcriptional regulator with XRE-family HTH domain